MTIRNDITFEQVRDAFDYRDGKLYWKRKASQMKPGDLAGCDNGYGYTIVRFSKKNYLAHRVIWLWHNEYLPETIIDHIDRDTSNNRIENLRVVSDQCNVRNSKTPATNKTGVRGVCWSKIAHKWHSYMGLDHGRKHLGYFDDFVDAVKARWDAEVAVNWSGCDSTSSSFLFLKEKELI